MWNVDINSENFGKEIETLKGHDEGVPSIAFSPNRKILASASYDGKIKLWNVDIESENFGKEIKTLKGHNGKVRSIAFSLDGKILASGSFYETVKLWDVDIKSENFGKGIKTLKGHNTGCVKTIAFSPNGKTFASGSSDKTVKLWILFEDKDFEVLNNIKKLPINKLLVVYFLINQHKNNDSSVLKGKAKEVFKGMEKNMKVFIRKVLK